jgi:hypothetical protein
VQPLSTAAAWFGGFPLVRTQIITSPPTIPEKAKMEINAVCERECKLKRKLRLTDSLVRRGIKSFRVTESSIDFIDSNNLVLLN